MVDDALGTAAGGVTLTAVDCAKGGCAGEDILIEGDDVERMFAYVVFPLQDASGSVGDASVQKRHCVLVGLLDDAEVGDFPRLSVHFVILDHVPYDQSVQMTVHAVQSIHAGGLQKAREGDVPVQRFGRWDSESRRSGRVQVVGEDEAVEVRSWSRWNIPLECTTTDTTKMGDVWAMTVSLALIVHDVEDTAEGIGKQFALSGEESSCAVQDTRRVLIVRSTSFWNVRMANSRPILPQAQRYGSSWQYTCLC